jgi:hypothetical protein
MKRIKWTLVVLSSLLFQLTVQAGLFKAISEKTAEETAKSTMVSIVKETRPFFKEGMSEATFLNNVLVDIPKQNRSPEITNYFKKVFYYHKSGLSEQEIHSQETGKTLTALLERAADTNVNGAFFVDSNDPLVADFKPKKWWIKILIQVLMALLNNL